MSKVLVGIPVRGVYSDVSPKTQRCLELMRATSPHAVEVFLSRGQQITQNSYNIITKALSEGWDYLLYTGDDITFPPTALDQLISRDKDIVAGVCTWKTPPYWVPAGMQVGDKLKYVLVSPSDIASKMLKQVDFAGSGFMLIKRKALQAVEEFLRDKVYNEVPKEYRWLSPVPYFPVTFDPDRNVITGSDFSFCRIARKAGCEIYLDCALVCGHRWEGEYDIRDHWRWVEEHGFSREEPQWPFEVKEFVPMDKDQIYFGPDQQPLPITITTFGNEYHAIEHVYPILKGHFAGLGEFNQYGKTPYGYIIGFHVGTGAQYEDYVKFADTFEKTLVHWVGSDILGIPKWINDERKARLNESRYIHLVEEDRLVAELAPYFDNVQVVSIPTAKVNPVDALPDNFTVAVYYPKHRHDFHYGDVLKGVIQAMPDVKFKLFHLMGEKPDFNYPNMAWLGTLAENEYGMQIARSSCTLRLSKHDGRPFTCVEFALAGRRVITNFDFPGALRVPEVPTVEDVVGVLRSIQKQPEPDQDLAIMHLQANSHVDYRKKLMGLLGPLGYEYENYWESRYAAGARGGGGPIPSGKEATWVNEAITKSIRDVHCETVLDVGCGTMVRWEKLPIPPSGYTGCDVSNKAIQIAQKKFPKANFFVADLTKDSIPQADTVIAIDVLPHIKEHHFKDVVTKIFRAARKTVIVKTSLGVNDGYYQHSHEWDGVVPHGWTREALGRIPDNQVAQFWVYSNKNAPVDNRKVESVAESIS